MIEFEDLRQCINDVQVRADNEVRRARSEVTYMAKHAAAAGDADIDAFVTGAGLGQTGSSSIADACRRLDMAKAQAAAVRNVFISIHAKFGDR